MSKSRSDQRRYRRKAWRTPRGTADHAKRDERRSEPPSRQVVSITFPYRGAASLSVNHYKVGGNMAYRKTPEARATIDEIVLRLRNALQFSAWTPKAPLGVRIDGTFKTWRDAIDLHNANKVILDAVQEATGVNDKFMSVETNLPTSGALAPEIRVTVWQRV